MDSEQVLKKLDWLDDERREDKTKLSSLEERLAALEGNIPPIRKDLKELDSGITRLSALVSRLDQFDEAVLQNRIEAKVAVEDLEKQVVKREDDREKVRRTELRSIEESIVDLRNEVSKIADLQRGIQAGAEEDIRLGRSIDEVKARLESVRRSDEEYIRSNRILEDGRRQDAKKITDLQGEVTALRKHVDDHRGRMELTSNALRKIETRFNELAVVEEERREAQEKFIETQTMAQVERDRTWKDWQNRFETIEQQTSDIETNLQTLDSTHRDVKRAQASLEELSKLVERRIGEMAEIQRLTEERFRQEWVTFKADDQKRWTNYTLTQEEQRSEVGRQQEKLVERVTQIEDMIQELQDILEQVNEQTEKRLGSLLAVVNDWVTTFERTVGRM
jgi:DNA repair exonuclease SbcCD ATPase subunit